MQQLNTERKRVKKTMLNNRFLIPMISIGLVIVLSVGLVFLFINENDKETEPDDPVIDTDSSPDHPFDFEPSYQFDHINGGAVVEFDEGNEIFLDTSLVAYLERLEFGVPATDADGNYYFDADGDIVYDMSTEKHVEGVLDNLITLINHFADKEYSMEASHQVQRFYVKNYSKFLETEYEDLVAKIETCIPKTGADAETIADTVFDVFGFDSRDGCAYLFEPFRVAEIKVLFCDVLPSDVVLTSSEELLCIYDSWRNPDDDGYERNLEGWLHNVIRLATESDLDEETTIVAQILYAGSLADAEYRADWDEALIRCMTVKEWTFDNLKLAVQDEFGVCIDYNLPLIEYFEANQTEVK